MRKITIILIALIMGCGVNCFSQGKVTNRKNTATVGQSQKNKVKRQISKPKTMQKEFNDRLNGVLYRSKTGNAESHDENLQILIDDSRGYLKIVIRNDDYKPIDDLIMLTEESSIREYEEKNWATNFKQVWSYSPERLLFTLPSSMGGNENMICYIDGADWRVPTVYGTGRLDKQYVFAYDEPSNTFTYCRTDLLNQKKQARTRFVANNVSPSKWAEIKAKLLNIMQDFEYIE